MNNYENNKTNGNYNTSVEFLRILFKWKKTIIVIFTSIVMISLIITFISPNIYESVATVLIRPGRENSVLDPTTTVGEVTTVRRDLTTEINSEIQIIKSRDIASITVNSLGVDFFENESNGIANVLKEMKNIIKMMVSKLTHVFGEKSIKENNEMNAEEMKKENTIKAVMNSLSCEAVADSNIIKLKYQSQKPKDAKAVLDTIVRNYLEKHMSVNRANGSYEFFKLQTNTLLETLETTGEQLENLKNESGISSIEQQRTLLLERVDSLKRTVADLESDQVASQEKIEVLKSSLQNIPQRLLQEQRTGAPSSTVEELKKKIIMLKLEESELLSKYSEESVPVTELRRQLKTAEELLKNVENTEEVTSGINSTYQQIELDIMRENAYLSSLKEKIVSLKTEMKNAEAELSKINTYEQDISYLNREYQISATNYTKYSEGKEQARIDDALENGKISNVAIAQECTLPIDPIKPNKKLNIGFGLFAGIFAGIGLAFFREYFNHTFTTPDEIEKILCIPAIGAFPVGKQKQNNKKEIPYVGKLFLPDDSINIITEEHEDKEINLDQEKLIDFKNSDKYLIGEEHENINGKIISITSSRTGEGVSTFSVYFSSMLRHHLDKKVLLIDTNFNNPTIHKILGGHLTPGFGEIIAKKTKMDVLQRSTLYGFDYLSAGKIEMNAMSMQERKKIRALLNRLKDQYEYVVLDTAPMWNGNGAKVSGYETISDGVILVVEAEKVRWEVARKSKERLDQMNAKVLGAILNKRRFHIPDWLYKRL